MIIVYRLIATKGETKAFGSGIIDNDGERGTLINVVRSAFMNIAWLNHDGWMLDSARIREFDTNEEAQEWIKKPVSEFEMYDKACNTTRRVK